MQIIWSLIVCVDAAAIAVHLRCQVRLDVRVHGQLPPVERNRYSMGPLSIGERDVTSLYICVCPKAL